MTQRVSTAAQARAGEPGNQAKVGGGTAHGAFSVRRLVGIGARVPVRLRAAPLRRSDLIASICRRPHSVKMDGVQVARAANPWKGIT
jgi:hypothetical protein